MWLWSNKVNSSKIHRASTTFLKELYLQKHPLEVKGTEMVQSKIPMKKLRNLLSYEQRLLQKRKNVMGHNGFLMLNF